MAFRDWRSLAQTEKPAQGAGIRAAEAAFHASGVRRRLRVGFQELRRLYHGIDNKSTVYVLEVYLKLRLRLGPLIAMQMDILRLWFFGRQQVVRSAICHDRQGAITCGQTHPGSPRGLAAKSRPSVCYKKQTSGVSTDPSGGLQTRLPSEAGRGGGWTEAYGGCRGRKTGDPVACWFSEFKRQGLVAHAS